MAMDHRIQEIPTAQVLLGRKLGQGGQGAVFEGEWEGKPVAVKVIENVSDSAHLARCLQEMLVLIALRHPNVLSVFGCCRPADGTLWLVMEFVEGGTLADRVKRACGPLPLNEALHCLLGLARALAHAHAKGLSHNDVKADNILLQILRDESFDVKLADFGLVAKLHTAGSRTFSHIQSVAGEGELGTINFLAPENLNPEDPNYGQASAPPVFSSSMRFVASTCVLVPFRPRETSTALRWWPCCCLRARSRGPTTGWGR